MTWPNNLFENLSALQQQYWETVLGNTQEPSTDNQNPLAQSMAWMEQWQSLAQSLLPEPLSSLKLTLPPTFTVGKLYADLADWLSGKGNIEQGDYEWWISRMESYYQDWQQQLENTPFAPLKSADLNTDLQTATQQWLAFQKQCQEQCFSSIQQGMDALQAVRNTLSEQPQQLTSFGDLNQLWQSFYQQAQNNTLQASSSFPNLMEAFSTWQKSNSVDQHNAFEQERQAAQQKQSLSAELAAATQSQQVLSEKNQALQGEVNQLKAQVGAMEQQLKQLKAPAVPASDDLTKIKGLGPKMRERLIDAGIQTFEQLASLSPEAANELDQALNAQGRLLRENWVAQAAELGHRQA